MPTLFSYSGQDKLHHGHLEAYCPPRKRARISAPLVLWGPESDQETKPAIDVLPDECLFEIFRHLPSQERSVCGCVSKHWLSLLTTIKSTEICPNDTDSLMDGTLTRSLEGKKANNLRLAAIGVRGGLGKLSIRGGTHSSVTNFGLSAIARGCPSLKSLSLWNVSSIGDEGLFEIANGCPMLEKLDLSQCPLITNKGLIAIAERCPNLRVLSIESCPNVGNDSMQALAQGCPKLESISIKDCPLVGDQGIASLLSSSSVLSKLKLQNLNISDFSLAVIGHYGKSITSLILTGLQNVTEKGFWVMGNAQGLKTLASLSVGLCFGVTDLSLEAISKGCSGLKHVSLRSCSMVSDIGISGFSKSAHFLETLNLEDCNKVTLSGIIETLKISCPKFRSLSLVKCLGLKDILPLKTLETPCMSLRSLSIKNCPSVGSASLVTLGKMCPNLKHIDLTGLYGVTDYGVISLLESCSGGLVKVNLSGCINLSDESVVTLARVHGETLKTLDLNSCRRITDVSLEAISNCCSLLNDLDVSNCPITDSGIKALSCSQELNLEILSISGCSRVSNKSLPFLIQLGKKNLVGLNVKHCNSLSNKSVSTLVGNLWTCDILC